MQTISLGIAAGIFFLASCLSIHLGTAPLSTAWARGVLAQASQR